MKSVLVLRHIEPEGPGYLGQVLERHGLPYHIAAVDRGEAIPPDPDEFAGLVLMGGPMSVNDDLPWIEPELELIREAVRRNIPVLGHCLGGQLISKALGGSVGPNPVREIGWHEVEKVSAAEPWLQGLPERFPVFHWHGETFTLPDGATPLLTNRFCRNQAFSIGNTLALQCHVEMTPAMVREWVELYRDELQHPTESLQAAADILTDVESRCAALQQQADVLYRHWLECLSG